MARSAATFVEAQTARAIRFAPRLDNRERAGAFVPEEPRHYVAQMIAYRSMPEEQLLDHVEVMLNTPIGAIISRPGMRTTCQVCGEEIMNEREIHEGGMTLCSTCAGDSYYQRLQKPVTSISDTIATR